MAIQTPFETRTSRRSMLKLSARAAAAASLFGSLTPLLGEIRKRRFKIGACDWSIGKMSDPSGLALAREIGLDGLQVSLGTEANGMHLCKPEVQQQYLDATRKAGVEIASLGIAEMNNVPYKSDARAVRWVADSIDAAQAMGVRVVLLAFFHKGDLRGDPPGVDTVVRQLKEIAPKAEKAKVVLGIESWLSAKEHMGIIDRVGSPAVQVYYDVCNSNDRGYDIYEEIRKLGRDRICEFHAKENGSLLGQGKVDFRKVREALDDIGYTGWIQIEGAVPPGKPMFEAYQANCAFLRKTFDT